MEEIIGYPDSPVGIPATLAYPLTEQERLYGLLSSSRSYWSFCTTNAIRCAFNHGSKDANGKKLHVPEALTDAFEDLVVNINVLPPRVPVTIVWNKHLPHFDSTREDQEFKAFADLPSDLPFSYGSLTALRISFRPWLESYAMLAFHIPGLEFFAITGTDKNNSEWRNPAGTWFRQVIPTGCQLLNLFDEIKKECIEANKDDPNYDYQDDSLDGRITWCPKGVHR